jgi:hypothetical protein
MPLTKKELERYLWEQPEACEARGLKIHQATYARGCRYQRLHLGAYGTAPLVDIRYWPDNKCYYVRVIVSTTGALTTALYQQAKRYAAGLVTLVKRTIEQAGIVAHVAHHTVLVYGDFQRIEDDLLFTLSLDSSCQAFHYYYGLEGIDFRSIIKEWHLFGPTLTPSQAGLADDIRAEYGDSLRRWQNARSQWLSQVATEPGELASSLVITSEGIVTTDPAAGKGESND